MPLPILFYLAPGLHPGGFACRVFVYAPLLYCCRIHTQYSSRMYRKNYLVVFCFRSCYGHCGRNCALKKKSWVVNSATLRSNRILLLVTVDLRQQPLSFCVSFFFRQELSSKRLRSDDSVVPVCALVCNKGACGNRLTVLGLQRTGTDKLLQYCVTEVCAHGSIRQYIPVRNIVGVNAAGTGAYQVPNMLFY